MKLASECGAEMEQESKGGGGNKMVYTDKKHFCATMTIKTITNNTEK